VVHEARYLPFGEERWVDGVSYTFDDNGNLLTTGLLTNT
jgi:hypothetical protein